ncbi:MAG: hypothetical protein ACD_52C00159G0003 [uncultured bacterium]|uniref:Diaminopimelate epimerase n=1 Tax=Candidatus Woesebacteria bacterium RIFCSPHIGHO2_12_FULL_41_24 TaxID=1802510 RepID=A0A1F8AQU6_9BACT|nr:MAG: hypothetical protein ACD_52C00159G0003 [uncultured bacterium]OGM13412.1 MAG: hypothetical protein A2W15_05955 [Candidatus Woesebacteria bacterium RBG_16_41_13]OGM30486.1 MAG: hypothetical protein A2873_02570 [Candidatus Woesebacteria bacterium RIFCSPHIGHO2_01_FULL_42_80]OGM35956.1 MAG: hypothetical protein A3D84_01745 [Candidatus Woesebacteria bacterium RIFCSPHIGHO2_02_FULL_42_20]OGM54152.1 MAG: hypothetical protein A3E44_00515 [Candidatus Woesebacteria bacterium RIFCSPHIGHO2_12_FULL_41
MNLKIAILSPGGNDTALVEPFVVNKRLKKIINDKIMKMFPNVEQVGFVDSKKLRIEMAGGEFCGNALRSAAYYFLKGKPGKLEIQASGVKNRLSAGVKSSSVAWAKMPVYKSKKKLQKIGRFTIVQLKGITHVVTDLQKIPDNKEELKIYGKSILDKLGLSVKYPASGVMFIKRTAKRLSLYPVVWVRDIETLFYETACASGSAAVGIARWTKFCKENFETKIIQPSGKEIKVDIKAKRDAIDQVTISGPIETVLSKTINL